MSTLKVDAIRHNSATSDAITTAADGTCTARITGMTGGGALSHRNKIINGAMTVKQRSDLTMTTSSTYSLDRWRAAVGSSFNWSSATVTQSTTSPDGFGSSLKVDIASTNTPTGSQNGLIQTKIEGQDLQDLAYGTSSAKQCTLSFYVRSNKTGTYCVQVANTANTKYVLFDYTINSADTWERKSVTFSGNTANTLNNDNALCFDVNFHLATGSDDHVSATSTWTTYSGGSYKSTSNQVNLFDNASNEWYLTGVQLEVGDTATSYEHRNFAEELEHCKRYFFVLGKDANRNTTQLSMPFINEHPSNTSGYINFRFQPEMRATPSVTIGSELQLGEPQVGMSNHKVSAFSGLSPTGSYYFQYTNQTGSTGDSNMYIRIGHHADSYAEFNAEM